MTAESVADQRLPAAPDAQDGDTQPIPVVQDLGPAAAPAVQDAETELLSVLAIRKFAASRAVEHLCGEFASVCESAVNPLEVASALEFDGISDGAAAQIYDFPDVFALADEMYRRVPRRPAEPEGVPSDPWQQFGRFRPALRALLYGLPGICFPAAAGLLAGPGLAATLIAALLISWSMSQGLAYLGYRRLGGPDADLVPPLLLAGLAAGFAVLMLGLALVAHVVHPQLSVLAFGVGEGVYMLSASLMMVLGAEQLLLVALAPGVLASAVFLALGRPPQQQHAVWAGLAATPVLAVALAAWVAGRAWLAGRAGRTGTPAGRLFVGVELRDAALAVAFGLVAAGLLVFPVAAGPDGHGGVNKGALLAALPLSLSMGMAEWSLLWYRRRMQRLLRSTAEVEMFRRRARPVLSGAVAQYLAGAAVLIVVAVVVADTTGLLHFSSAYLPQLAAYLVLGAAMFIALLLQAFGDRALPLAAASAALGAEIACHDFGVTDQLLTVTGLFLVLAAYATWAQASAVRHAY